MTATLALVVALGGTGYAVVAVPKNSVGSKQIVNGAVKSVDVKDNGLKGSDIDESTVGTVPNAGALQGRSLRGISQWVYVNSVGSVGSQSGGITVTNLPISAGRYRVSFPTSIAGCGLNANGAAGFAIGDTAGISGAVVMVERSSTGPNDVQIMRDNDSGTAEDGSFWLTAQC